MRLFLVAPRLADNSDETAVAARRRECAEPIAELILRHLESDPALFAMRHVNESSDTAVKLDTRYGHIDVVRITDGEILREILLGCGDPYSDRWILIRSLVTCRAVFYGDDGQIFVCLPHDDLPITSPDNTLIAVEDCSHMLAETDLMDGLAAL